MFLTPPIPYHLRPMQLEDVEQIMPIERRVFPTPWPSAGYRHELTHNEHAHYIVLSRRDGEGEEQIIGYGGYWLVAHESHISTIAVDIPYRGRGLGSLLLLQMIFHCIELGADVIRLEVRESNRAARRLYAQYGFVTVGRRRGYYRDRREDAILMDLNIAGEDVHTRFEERRAQLWRRLAGAGEPGDDDSQQ